MKNGFVIVVVAILIIFGVVYFQKNLVSHGPINRVENGFTFNDVSTEFEHFQNLTQFQINESPVTYELIWLPQPEETYVLEPTRFRKTYTFFRQRSRQKK
jgi:hypothetical protein